MGYGLLGLMPEQLFSLTLTEFYDMVNARLTYSFVTEDKEMERLAWQTSLLMSATGNYGKRGIDPAKLYKRVYDDMGNVLADKKHGAFTPIDKEVKESKLNELIAKFNRE